MSLEEKVKDIIVDRLGVPPEKVTPDAHFIEDLGADSLDTVELVMFLMKMPRKLPPCKRPSII